MRAKNKIISGFLQEYHFVKKYGKLYLKCLESEFAVNQMTVQSVQVIDQREVPSLGSMLMRGFILSKIFGLLGIVAGTATAKTNAIYHIKMTFENGGSGLAEVDQRVYDLLVRELFGIIPY